jgi:hypothetical protein
VEDWWATVADLGQDALIWLLGLATHGGTYRDKPPRVGAGKTSNVKVELGQANRYAEAKGLTFDWKNGYQRLQNVDVVGPGNKPGRMLTKAKSGGLMQFTAPVGIAIFHHIAGSEEFRSFLEDTLGIAEGGVPDPVFQPHEDSPIQFEAEETDDPDVVLVTASLECPRCKETVTHQYRMRPFGDAGNEEAPYAYVAVACAACELGMRHFRGQPWCPPEVVD